MQRELTARLGTAGATHVRFLFGFPFALALSVRGAADHRRVAAAAAAGVLAWVVVGMGAQIARDRADAAAMGERSFVVTIAYIKTEPMQVAMFGLIFLGDALTAG